ncbi:MAG: hypothetical protein E6889_04610 [Staphylococcus epidermidis]|nr:hypothetical protein [Staphylococcus epidermidis]
MNEQKLIKLLEFYKQYKALSGYIDKKYKLTLNDLAVLYLAKRSNRDERKIFLYMDENNMSEFDALFEDVEKFLSC